LHQNPKIKLTEKKGVGGTGTQKKSHIHPPISTMNFASFIYYVWQISLHIKNAILHKKRSFSFTFLPSGHLSFTILRLFGPPKLFGGPASFKFLSLAFVNCLKHFNCFTFVVVAVVRAKIINKRKAYQKRLKSMGGGVCGLSSG